MTLLLLCLILGADLPHLGTITPRRPVALSANSTRPDFHCFIVEARPQDSTNVFTITITNGVLSVSNMVQVPSGSGIIGVRSCFKDGEESEPALYRYDLRRAKPPKPSATPLHILGTPEQPNSLTNELRKIRGSRQVPTPPMPQVGKSAASFPQDVAIALRPLPDATNREYSQFLDWQADRANRGKRRSE